jgi:DNA-binding beta-propeller fold protein YncE
MLFARGGEVMTQGPLLHAGYVALPKHAGKGAFDHAAVHAASGHIYVAHTANDAVDVFDPASGRHLFSLPHLLGVAGVLVSDEAQLIVTSNRAENTIGVFAPGPDPQVMKIRVGVHPNGLAYDPGRRLILAANVGDPQIPGSQTISMVGLDEQAMLADIRVPGRTRWAIYDPDAEAFYVNIADPAQIVVIDAHNPRDVARVFPIPSAGPHGLDLDRATHRLFCACDSGTLITLDARSGKILGESALSGAPDVIFFNRARRHLYVAVGDPGVIDVFDTTTMKSLGRTVTERGAHTLALAPAGDRLCAFLPETHRAAIYQINEGEQR